MANSSAMTRLVSFFSKVVLAFIALIIILILALPIGFYGMALFLEPTLPSVNEIKKAEFEMPLQIYTSDEKLIGLYGNRMSMPVERDDIPEKMVQAFLSAEDAAFYEHTGISVKGLGRALTEALTDDESQTGGSTITMQVAKNYFLTPKRTLNRKLTELFLARKIEEELTKDEIMTLYVNKIYLGEGAYGIQAAARKYFSKTLDTLTIAESAMIAGLPKAPSAYNPVVNPERALKRRNWIIGQMLRYGYITQAEHDEAIAAPIGLNVYEKQTDLRLPYISEMARYSLVNQYGSRVMNSGWKVKLTVNSNTQKRATRAVQNHLIRYDKRHGWRGAEGNIEKGNLLANYRAVGSMYPAQVTKVMRQSFEAKLKNGDTITVPWSGMGWAKKYINANRVGDYPSSASKIVSEGDIVRVTPNGNSWKLNQIPKVQASLVSVEPETGKLIALVGGYDYDYSKFNRATDAWRQPGSTIKPLIYAAAIEKGYTPESLISDDQLKVGDWKPRNSDGTYRGMLSLRQGLYLSRNLVSIRLLNSVGISNARLLLDQFGLDKEKLPNGLSLALGTGQASPLQMATAYSTFANGGYRIQPYFIEQIYAFDNKLLYQANPQRACASCFNDILTDLNKANETKNKDAAKTTANNKSTSNQANTTTNDKALNDKQKNTDETRTPILSNARFLDDRIKSLAPNYKRAEQAPRILSENAANSIANIMRDVIQVGTGQNAKRMGRLDIGGKTGTTNDYRDAWFAGFHPTISTVVWVGFDKPSTLGRYGYGGKLALPVWVDFMAPQLGGKPYQWVEEETLEEYKRDQKNTDNTNNDTGTNAINSRLPEVEVPTTVNTTGEGGNLEAASEDEPTTVQKDKTENTQTQTTAQPAANKKKLGEENTGQANKPEPQTNAPNKPSNPLVTQQSTPVQKSVTSIANTDNTPKDINTKPTTNQANSTVSE